VQRERENASLFSAADALTETIAEILVAQQDKPAALRSISAAERMAALVQTMAAREHPLSEQLRAKLPMPSGSAG
jgi:hypothetical protein